MNRYARATLAVLLIGLVSACGSQPIGRPVENPTQRIEIVGASVLPPQGNNWLVAYELGKRVTGRVPIRIYGPPDQFRGSRPFAIAFSKSPVRESADPTHTLIAQAEFVELREHKLETLADFREYIQWVAYLGSGPPADRFRITDERTSVASDFGAHCFRYDSVSEERENARVPNAVLVLTISIVLCRHPLDPRYAISVSYSERYKTEQGSYLDDALRSELDAFRKSVVFIPVTERP